MKTTRTGGERSTWGARDDQAPVDAVESALSALEQDRVSGTVDLQERSLDDAQCDRLAAALGRAECQVTELDLSSATLSTLTPILRALVRARRLERLKLGYLCIFKRGGNFSLHDRHFKLLEQLLQKDRLRELDLSGQNLCSTQQGQPQNLYLTLGVLFEALGKCSTLETLTLKHARFDETSLGALSVALQRRESLSGVRCLDLRHVNVGAEQVATFVLELASNNLLRVLLLSASDGDAAAQLAEAAHTMLGMNKTLCELVLPCQYDGPLLTDIKRRLAENDSLRPRSAMAAHMCLQAYPIPEELCREVGATVIELEARGARF
jgi:hypothetical protein